MMNTKRVLFLYLTKHSGHYAAAVAIEEALRRLDSGVETMLLDSFSHANPLLSKVTLRAYLAILKTAPELWEYMYDNPEFKERTKKIHELLNRGNSKKLQRVLDKFHPDVVVSTQAFSCGVMATWKRNTGNHHVGLVGVLTDFVAHRYWGAPEVDLYIAPTDATRQTLLAQGVPDERVRVYGIPISHVFREPVDAVAVVRRLGLRPDLPKIVVMGGSLGLGPVKSVIRKLDKLPQPFDIIAIAGKNADLRERLERQGHKLRHPTKIIGFAENIHELMSIAEVLVTKPGGITTAEALTKAVPMIIINPIPGQEQKNTDVLLANGVAVQARRPAAVAEYVGQFLRDPEKTRQMRRAARPLSRPFAAEDAARDLYALLNGSPVSAAARRSVA
jgi:processive 1,2-diacylglycerol beta-glucosyltransferase